MRWKLLFTIQNTLISLLVVAVAPARAQSEATVRGQIVAGADGSVLARGSATLKSVETGVLTQTAIDPTGHFVFQNVRPGDYVLSGSAEGFSNREIRVVLEPREIKTVTLALELRPLDVNVSVTGELPSLPSTHSPSSTVLTSERLESLPAFPQPADQRSGVLGKRSQRVLWGPQP
jgi:Carboxypeptidase regulatory-like domain